MIFLSWMLTFEWISVDGFYNEMRTPCVIFTGHPSLRFGDVVHFMGLWAKSTQNTIIFTGENAAVCAYMLFMQSYFQVDYAYT